ncbi:MAG: HAD family phosphatase, partial [Erysipelotrichaceae bacterium]|nr:HAD family phosphatase [Erysipelotrichaceae bacterium]
MIKAILLDIDGTLVTKQGIITERTKEALLRAGKQGIKLILASGRPVNGMLHLAREIGMDKHHGLCVAFNGAQVLDVTTGEILFNQTMSVDLCKRILHHMKNFEVRPMIVKGDY